MASGEAFGEDSLATKDIYVDENGKTVERKRAEQKIVAQLSGETFGDGLDKSFTHSAQPTRREHEGDLSNDH